MRRNGPALAGVVLLAILSLAACSSLPGAHSSEGANASSKTASHGPAHSPQPKAQAASAPCTPGTTPLGQTTTAVIDGITVTIEGGKCFDRQRTPLDNGLGIGTSASAPSSDAIDEGFCKDTGLESTFNKLLGHGLLEVTNTPLTVSGLSPDGVGGVCQYMFDLSTLRAMPASPGLYNIGISVGFAYVPGQADQLWTQQVGAPASGETIKALSGPGVRTAETTADQGDDVSLYAQSSDGVFVGLRAEFPSTDAKLMASSTPELRTWAGSALSAAEKYLTQTTGDLTSGRTAPNPSGLSDTGITKILEECPAFINAGGGSVWVQMTTLAQMVNVSMAQKVKDDSDNGQCQQALNDMYN